MSEGITLEEVQRCKLQAETVITEALLEFTRKTGLPVANLNVRSMDITSQEDAYAKKVLLIPTIEVNL